MKRSIASLCVLCKLFAASLYGQAILDTIYFEDFVDNRHAWSLTKTEAWEQSLEDGYLHVVATPQKGPFSVTHVKVPLMQPDTFVYEVKLSGGPGFEGGVAVDVCTESKRGLCHYLGFRTYPKGVVSYSYGNSSDDYGNYRRMPTLDRSELVFRVTYDGKWLRYLINGELAGSYRYRPARKHASFQRWGFISKGVQDYKVDYLLLLAPKQQTEPADD